MKYFQYQTQVQARKQIQTSFSYTRCSVRSRIWTLRRTVPSRTKVTGLNCSDHSTSLKNWPRGELWRFYPTRIQIRLREAHYAVTPLWEPTNIVTLRRKERRFKSGSALSSGCRRNLYGSWKTWSIFETRNLKPQPQHKVPFRVSWLTKKLTQSRPGLCPSHQNPLHIFKTA